MVTNSRTQPRVTVSDPWVLVSQGTARINNTVVNYDGTRATFSEMAAFKGSTGYRAVLPYLAINGVAVDMTSVLSDATTTSAAVLPPSMPSDTSGGYAGGYPLGVFTFQSTDGTVANLVSYRIA